MWPLLAGITFARGPSVDACGRFRTLLLRRGCRDQNRKVTICIGTTPPDRLGCPASPLLPSSLKPRTAVDVSGASIEYPGNRCRLQWRTRSASVIGTGSVIGVCPAAVSEPVYHFRRNKKS